MFGETHIATAWDAQASRFLFCQRQLVMFHGVNIARDRRVNLTRELERIRHDSIDA